MDQDKKRVEFKISAPDAKQVMLSGSFNRWSDRSDPMKRDRSGTWKKVKMLPKGQYEYKFIVDDAWILDPNCRETAANQHGTHNSVILV
jgi:1,4-alpha-glucan branching enzyme